MTNQPEIKIEALRMELNIAFGRVPNWENVFLMASIRNAVSNTYGIDSNLSAINDLIKSKELKAGRGGSHIWISDLHSNERLIVIYYK